MKHSYLKLFLLCLCLSIGTNTFAYDAEIDGIYYDFFLGEAYVTYRYSFGGSYSGDITIPSSVTYKGTTYSVKNIGYRAFYSCRISSIKLPNSVMTIGGQAFAGCSLTSVIIPNSVTTIGEQAFSSCRGLTSITMGNGVTSIGEDAFDSCYDLEKVIVPDIAAWCRINFDGYSSSNPIYESNHLYSDETTEITELIIPEGVKTINSNAFTGCWSLTSVTIPNSVNSIGSFSFSDCRYLTSAIIGNGVTSIGVAAFDGCSSLTSLTIPSSVTSIGNNAFGGTAWLNNQPDGLVYAGKVAYCYKGTMPDGTHIAIKEGTTEIAAYAFARCSGLTSVNIPISVTSIDRSAFAACSGLTSVIP